MVPGGYFFLGEAIYPLPDVPQEGEYSLPVRPRDAVISASAIGFHFLPAL